MTKSEAMLVSLWEFILKNDPLPIAWVVKNGDEFERWWMKSRHLETMVRLASRVVSRQELVLAVAAVAATALRYVPPGEDRPAVAIGTAESWAKERFWATTEEVRKTAIAAVAAADLHDADYASRAAAFVARTVYLSPPTEDADNAVFYTKMAGVSKLEMLAAFRSQNIKITVADLVRAGKSGWNPSNTV